MFQLNSSFLNPQVKVFRLCWFYHCFLFRFVCFKAPSVYCPEINFLSPTIVTQTTYHLKMFSVLENTSLNHLTEKGPYFQVRTLLEMFCSMVACILVARPRRVLTVEHIQHVQTLKVENFYPISWRLKQEAPQQSILGPLVFNNYNDILILQPNLYQKETSLCMRT